MRLIGKNYKYFGLTDEDYEQLKAFGLTTHKIACDYEPRMENIRKELKKAGFTIIHTPGVFFREKEEKLYMVNFMNAVTGFSPKTGHYYYIAGGAQGRIGQILMDVFAEFIHSQCENTVVYYTGRKSTDPTDFQEAESSQNTFYCGPHCLTNELETGEHIAT